MNFKNDITLPLLFKLFFNLRIHLPVVIYLSIYRVYMVTVRLQSFTPNRSLDLAVAQEHNLVAVALMDSATPIMLPSRATSVTSAATRYEQVEESYSAFASSHRYFVAFSKGNPQKVVAF